MALRLMMMHHNTKFENKMFGGLEDITWTNINLLGLHCDLDLECSNPSFFFFFGRTLWLMMMRPSLVTDTKPKQTTIDT